MAARRKTAESRLQPPKIHKAELASGPTGAVIKGAEIDQSTAVACRRAGENIVVCGSSLRANRDLARAIEGAIGPYERQEPHDKPAGPLALPHFQQISPSAKGHSFYETENRKAKAKP